MKYDAAAAMRRYHNWATAAKKQWEKPLVASAGMVKTPSPVVIGHVTSQDVVHFNEVENNMRAAAPIKVRMQIKMQSLALQSEGTDFWALQKN